jgi:hypothetical protein
MAVKKTAFRAIDLRLEELTNGLESAERKVLAEQGRGGAAVVALVDECERRLKLLADLCANRRGWATKYSIFPGWTASAAWTKKSAAALDSFHAAASERLGPFCSKLASNDVAVIKQARDMLDERAHLTKEKLQIELQSKHDEALGETASRTIGAFWKFVLPTITALAASFLTWVVAHLPK